MIERICPVCTANTHTPLLAKDSVKLVRCSSCAMIFASPVPESYINGSFYEHAGRPFYLSPEKLSGDYSPVRFTRELRLFREACPAGKVLDVGCSNGAFLFQLGERFPGAYELFGTDVSGPALEYAETKGVQTIRGDFLAADFPKDFDAITLWAVLEHVSEPARFVQQAARLLKPGGICIVLVPNWNSLARRILNGRYRYILGQHLNYFDEASLRGLFAAHFEVARSIYTHFNPLVIKEDLLDSRREPSSAERAQLLQKTNRLKEGKGTLLKSAYHAVESILSRLHLTDNVALVVRKPVEQRNVT